VTDFDDRNRAVIHEMVSDQALLAYSQDWLLRSAKFEYSYHFRWLGLPIIQYPQDMIAMQELIWETSPSLIVETGIARGGSLIFYASLLALAGSDGRVIGIDIDIRPPNRSAIERHPMFNRIDLIEGSSIAPEVVKEVYRRSRDRRNVMVVLDSLHTHDHVLGELELYSPLVSPGGYIVVFDTIIETMPSGSFPNRPWDRGDNPATAVKSFLAKTDRFEVDRNIDDKLLISTAPGGYLRCVKA
jgi:cephalosporin hydroxylase